MRHVLEVERSERRPDFFLRQYIHKAAAVGILGRGEASGGLSNTDERSSMKIDDFGII